MKKAKSIVASLELFDQLSIIIDHRPTTTYKCPVFLQITIIMVDYSCILKELLGHGCLRFFFFFFFFGGGGGEGGRETGWKKSPEVGISAIGF